ncbi:diguanylate cyclase [Rheinheimera sp. 4Y26]|uniref:diguanylate cyclase n=1 Tax=Rheinheimera sp. 4Y26 TaxID=2977811 RepID=UPI0021B0C62E|nr:diguanylate cyclase [Rheinheimera sp. 4Y26]MCT6700879.1 diguanylate cyclase [Rheinheimera sp. 4Y26]
MTNAKEKLEQQMALLHQQYLDRLQQELPQLQQQLDQLDTTADWRPLVAKLLASFHTLAGSAGTFGFHELGQSAKALELQAKNWLADTNAPAAEQIDSFRHIFSQLRQQKRLVVQQRQQLPVAAKSNEKKQTLIYLLEDEGDTARHLCLTLSTFGYVVEWFKQSHLLQAALLRKLPDALIIDIELPEETESGLSFVERMQQQLPEQLPLFVISGHDHFDFYLKAVRCGALGYFVKPINAQALEARLQRLLAGRQRDAFRVLIVDDDQLLAKHYALVLETAGLRAEILNDPADIFAGLRKFHPDVILLDVNMPQCTGPELAQLIRLQDEWLGVPIIYLSSETDSERQLAVLIKAGDDFLTKPISDNALVVAIFARAQRARQLAEVMTKDSLTGLLQHAHIKERLATELERSDRAQQQVSVVMLDIDHFKKVNDNYGHLTGDQVITSLANLLKQQLRKTDMIGRYGGEEFLLVLPDCPVEKAFSVIDKLRESFAGFPFSFDNHTFYCTFSAGIACGNGHLQPDLVIEQADQALYQAKTNGRNQVRIFAAPVADE